MSNPRQDQTDERQNQPEEANLFDHVGPHDEQADAADDNEREAIKQLAYGGGALPEDGAQGPHQERQGRRQNQHEAHRFNPSSALQSVTQAQSSSRQRRAAWMLRR